MKRSEIEVGTDVAVFVSDAYYPHGRVGWGTGITDRERLSDVPQSDRNPSTTYLNESYLFRATVEVVGVRRYERESRNHNVWKAVENGIRVRLKKPIRVGWRDEESLVFVAKAQQVVSTWADVEARRRAAVDRDAQWRAKCDEFAPVLARFLKKLRASGFKNVAVYLDGSGLYADGGLRIKLRAYHGRPYAIASHDSVGLDFPAFMRILGEDPEGEEEE